MAGIARILGPDRKTIRTYLSGHRAPGQPRMDAFAPFVAYLSQRAADDLHLRRTTLHLEITALGYGGSYPSFNRELRSHGITTGCGTCRPRQPCTPPPPQHPAQLPARVAPIAGEALSSYLARLATASHVPVTNITGCLPPWFASRAAACEDLNSSSLPRPGDAAYLAALAGISEGDLRHALPALALPAETPPAGPFLQRRHIPRRSRQRSWPTVLPVREPTRSRDGWVVHDWVTAC